MHQPVVENILAFRRVLSEQNKGLKAGFSGAYRLALSHTQGVGCSAEGVSAVNEEGSTPKESTNLVCHKIVYSVDCSWKETTDTEDYVE